MVVNRNNGQATLIRQRTRQSLIREQQQAQQRQRIQAQAQAQRKQEQERLKQARPSAPQTLTKVVTSKGGASVNLTQSELKEVRERLNSALEKGRLGLPSENPNVRKAVSFQFSEIARRGFATGQRFLTKAEQRLQQRVGIQELLPEKQEAQIEQAKVPLTKLQKQEQFEKALGLKPLPKALDIRKINQQRQLQQLDPIQQMVDIPTQPVLTKQKENVIKEIFFGKQSEKFLGLSFRPRISFLQRADISSAELSAFLQKRGGLPGKVIGGVLPKNPGEAAILATIARLGVVPGLTSKITGGVVGTLGAAQAASPELPVETRITGGLIALLPVLQRVKLPQIEPPTGTARLGTSTAQAFEILGKRLKKVDKKKITLDEARVNLLFKKEGKVLKDKTAGEKIADINKIFKEIKKTKDPALRQKQSREAVELIRRTHGKEVGDKLLLDFAEQQGFSFQQAKFTKAPTRTIPQIPKTSSARERNIARVETAQTKRSLEIVFEKEKNQLRSLIVNRASPQEKVLQQQRVNQAQKNLQNFRQQTQQRQQIKQRTQQATTQAQAQRTKQIQQQRLRSKQALKKLLKPGTKAIAKPKLIRTPKILKKEKAPTTPFQKKGFDVFTRKKGKVKKLGTTRTRSGGRDLGASNTAKKLRASFWVNPSKKVGKKIPTELQGFYEKNKQQFRRPRKNSTLPPNAFVERKGRRLDSKTEVQTIQKKRKRFKIKSSPMIKKKRKKK